MFCDGRSLNKEEYSDLYNIIGNTYGSDSTTFKLPDLRDRFIYGTEDDLGSIGGEAEHKLTIEEIPSHAHGTYRYYSTSSGSSAYIIPDSSYQLVGSYSVSGNSTPTKPQGEDQPHNNLPPYIKLIYIIKVLDDISIETNEILDKLKNDIINEVSLKMHPIGSIYITMDDKDPSTIYGGTWKKIEDRFLLGSGDNVVGVIGGEKDHILTEGEMPSHNHLIADNTEGYVSAAQGSSYSEYCLATARNVETQRRIRTLYAGESQAHNNMPPYIVVNIWERIS